MAKEKELKEKTKNKSKSKLKESINKEIVDVEDIEDDKDITKIKDYVEKGKVRKTTKENKNGEDKALFIKRLIAFCIDMVIISFIASLLSMPFIDSKAITELQDKQFSSYEKYSKQEINYEEYLIEFSDISYKLAREEGVISIITILLVIVYFVIYQLKNNGQTFGKELMKIKIISDDGELNTNQMIFRTFITDYLLLYIISFVFMLFLPKSNYYSCVAIFSGLQFIVLVVSCFMIMFREDGRGVQDVLCKTRVINVSE